jgi:UDP-hydrolysing UDP-N-acetyl-D-glucosamine 2-epimerase
MMKICVLTTTRADYGIYYWLLKDLAASAKFELQLVVSGTHLEPDYGNTIDEIHSDGFAIAQTIKIFDGDTSEKSSVRAMAKMEVEFYDCLLKLNPDFVVLLGDRFEMVAAALACALVRKPIIHLHGGELTKGAMDDAFRHAITKLSYLHFAATEEYRRRIVQMGESPERVFSVGALGLDHTTRGELPTRAELEKFIGLSLDRPTLAVTFHPATLDTLAPAEQIQRLLSALEQFPETQIVFTLPNADIGRWEISEKIEAWLKMNETRARAFRSLGHLRYLSLMKNASTVVGNSSSGIIEAPSFGTPTLNIGSRQEGRVRAKSVVDVEMDTASIVKGLKQTLAPGFRKEFHSAPNPYGDGHASTKIMSILEKTRKPMNLTKEFYEGLA